MKTYNSREIFWLSLRDQNSQLQRYKWILDRNEKADRFLVLEMRPRIPVGLIKSVKVEYPIGTDFDTKIFNSWNGCSCHPSIDSTQLDNTIHCVSSFTGSDRLLFDNDVEAYFTSGYKSMKNEKETLKLDNTRGEEPILVLVIERNTGALDGTIVFGEILIEGFFPPDDKLASLSNTARKFARGGK